MRRKVAAVPDHIMQAVVEANNAAVEFFHSDEWQPPNDGRWPGKYFVSEFRSKVAEFLAPKMGSFRFSKDYRFGSTPSHAAVYCMVDTVEANWRADQIGRPGATE